MNGTWLSVGEKRAETNDAGMLVGGEGFSHPMLPHDGGAHTFGEREVVLAVLEQETLGARETLRAVIRVIG